MQQLLVSIARGKLTLRGLTISSMCCCVLSVCLLCRWVQQQSEECLDELWLDGAEAYQRFIRQLLGEFRDVIGDGARARTKVCVLGVHACVKRSIRCV